MTSIGWRAFRGWSSSQTINIQGKANRAAADKAWGEKWREWCGVKIKYSKK